MIYGREGQVQALALAALYQRSQVSRLSQWVSHAVTTHSLLPSHLARICLGGQTPLKTSNKRNPGQFSFPRNSGK
jgi:hypothetical protein